MPTCTRYVSSICASWSLTSCPSDSLLTSIYSYDLPPDVFEKGEVQPTKKKAKVAAKTAEVANKKRSFSNAGLDVGDDRVSKTNRLRLSNRLPRDIAH